MTDGLGGASYFHDINLSDAMNATSSATSGAVTTGDRIVGGTNAKAQFGLVKMLVVFAGAVILLKLWKGKK